MSKGRRGVQSSRELRRANEREQKRQANKDAMTAYWNLPEEERRRRVQNNEYIQRMERNGITIEDVNRAAQEGYQDGAKIAADNTMRNIYAAIALVMHENYGFGKKRCMDVLRAVDEKVMYAIDSKEMVQQVFDELKIKMTFDGDPLDERIVDEEA